MPKLTLVFAALLILLGLGFYLDTGAKTALIPSGAGVLFAVCGVAALREPFRKHAMHLAAALALLGLLGTAPGIPKLIRHLSGTEIDRPAAAAAQAIMALLCIAYVGAGVRSFLAARKAGEGTRVQASDQ